MLLLVQLDRKYYQKLNQCPKCGESGYKDNDISGDEDDDVSKKHPLAKVSCSNQY